MDKDSIIIIFLITLIDVSLLLYLYFLLYPNILISKLFGEIEKHDGLIGVIGVIVVVSIFVIQLQRENNRNIALRIKEKEDQEKELKERMVRLCDTLINEINCQLNDIRNFKGFKVNQKDDKGNKIYYTNVYFNLGAFESILNSGLFTYFDEVIQTNINLLYNRLDLHNKHLDTRHEIKSFAILLNKQNDTDVKERISSYDLMLTHLEEKIGIFSCNCHSWFFCF